MRVTRVQHQDLNLDREISSRWTYTALFRASNLQLPTVSLFDAINFLLKSAVQDKASSHATFCRLVCQFFALQRFSIVHYREESTSLQRHLMYAEVYFFLFINNDTQIFAAFQTQEQSTCCNNFYPALSQETDPTIIIPFLV
jgi:hypothetical protein